MLYDGVCGLCNGGVDAALALDRESRLRFAALQSPAGRRLLVRAGRSPDDVSSVVLVTPEAAHFKSEAVLQIARTIAAPIYVLAAALAAPLPRGVRDAAYDGVADNRYSFFGRRDACRRPPGGGASGGNGRFLVD